MGRHAAFALLFILGFGFGCSERGGTGSVDSESHWMQPCGADADCQDGLACLCGVCTAPCAPGDCSSLDDAVCSAAVQDTCDVPTPLCLPRCDVVTPCDAGLVCVEGACVPGIDGVDGGPDPEPDAAIEPDMSVEPDMAPAEETCNGVDDDGDAQIDEGLEPRAPCSLGDGVCRADDLERCIAGEWRCGAEPGPAGDEVCNGLDDDCDGDADEGLDCFLAPPPALATCAADGFLVLAAGQIEDAGTTIPVELNRAHLAQQMALEAMHGFLVDTIVARPGASAPHAALQPQVEALQAAWVGVPGDCAGMAPGCAAEPPGVAGSVDLIEDILDFLERNESVGLEREVRACLYNLALARVQTHRLSTARWCPDQSADHDPLFARAVAELSLVEPGEAPRRQATCAMTTALRRCIGPRAQQPEVSCAGPVAVIRGPAEVREGEPVRYTGNGSAGAIDTYTWDVGQPVVGVEADVAWADQGPQQITLEVTGPGGDADVAVADITVTDIDPVLAELAMPPGVAGARMTLTFSCTPLYEADPIQNIAVDWTGGGGRDEQRQAADAPDGQFALNHVFPVAGEYPVLVKCFDEDSSVESVIDVEVAAP